MNDSKGVSIDPDGTILIDDPEIEAALHELARCWNVSAGRALAISVERALARDTDRLEAKSRTSKP